jgi:hypothetical protein
MSALFIRLAAAMLALAFFSSNPVLADFDARTAAAVDAAIAGEHRDSVLQLVFHTVVQHAQGDYLVAHPL